MARIQFAHTEAAGSATTIAQALSGVLAGSMIVVAVGTLSNATTTITGVQDDLGNVGVQVGRAIYLTNGYGELWVIANSAAGARTYTATFSATITNRYICAIEADGATSSPLDQTAKKESQDSTNPNTAAVTTGFDGEYCVALSAGNPGTSLTATAPYGDLYTVSAKGSQRHQLTRDRAIEQYPVWSPDGRSIAYEKGGLYKLPASGGKPRLLLGKSSLKRVSITGISDLSWSARGRFAFTATKLFLTPFEVWTYMPNGRLKRVTNYGLHPTWSPAGTRIAYSGKTGIFIVGANGRRSRRVPGTTRADSSPMWSPDGKWIAVNNAHTDKRNQQVFSIDILSPVRRLRTRIVTGRFIFPAAWSPTSDAILFQRSSGPPPYGPRQLFIVGIRGGQPRPVPGTEDSAGPASWHR